MKLSQSRPAEFGLKVSRNLYPCRKQPDSSRKHCDERPFIGRVRPDHHAEGRIRIM